MKVLVTGFKPFGGSPFNPSEQIARALSGQSIAGAQVITTVLPVDCQRSPGILLEALQDIQPDRVLCLGEAAGRAALSIERVAINLLDFRLSDNSGQQISDKAVVPGGPAAYFVSLPIRRIYQALTANRIPAELSLSAGAYLCNQVLYHLLHHITVQRLNIPAGFIHLPRLPQQTAGQPTPQPSMSLEISLAGVGGAIAVIVNGS